MDRFLTERETEALLREETRYIEMPDGERRALRLFTLVWNSFDMILRTGTFNSSAIFTLASQHSQRTGEAFEISFERVVGTIHRKLCD